MKKCILVVFAFWLIIFLLNISVVSRAEPLQAAYTSLELIPEFLSVAPGQTFRVALSMTMDPFWHVYWRNPGDSGMATRLAWAVPDYASVGALEWPYPQRIDNPPLTTYGYEGQVVLFSPVTVHRAVTGKETLPMTVDVQWLACKVECIPGQAKLTLNLPIAESPQPNPRFNTVAAPFLADIPVSAPDWGLQAVLEGESIRLQIAPPVSVGGGRIGRVQFFPLHDDVLQHSASPRLRKTEKNNTAVQLILPLASTFPKGGIPFLDGVLLVSSLSGRDTVLAVHAPVSPAGDKAPPLIPALRPSVLTLWLAVVFAFIGGVILNLLPCVLPVLSIKILRLSQNAEQNQQRLWQEELLFALGILTMFWVLAGLILCLKAFGIQVGWGFQLQHPAVVIGLSALFFCIVLYLWDILQIGSGVVPGARALPVKNSRYASFSFGLLTTVCATPCTAPFMGVALGYALLQPAYIALLVFTAMGLGMAAPYLLLARLPGLRRFIPKPGPWMLNLKITVGFVLLATIGKFVEILGLQVGLKAVVALYYFLLALGAGAWLRTQSVKQQSRILSVAVNLFAAGLVGFAAFSAFRVGAVPEENLRAHRPAAALREARGVPWKKFSEAAVEAALNDGKDVFINFTAAWCMTCQVNDAITFHNPDVVAALSAETIVAFKADWTRYDKQITRALNKHSRSSVPFYVYYKADAFSAAQEGIPLPEILTPRIMLEVTRGSHE